MNEAIKSVPSAVVTVGKARFGNDLPFGLLAGPCVLESRAHALETAAGYGLAHGRAELPRVPHRMGGGEGDPGLRQLGLRLPEQLLALLHFALVVVADLRDDPARSVVGDHRPIDAEHSLPHGRLA